jgi:rod shape-determining protein MreD
MELYTATPRPKVEIYQLNPIFIVLLAVLALAVQSFLPVHFDFARLLDLPLLVVVYFGMTRRNASHGVVVGSLVGLAQDSLTRGPLGMNGIVKTVIGYVTTFLSVRFDVDNRLFRFTISLICYWLNYFLLLMMSALLLRFPIPFDGLLRLLASLVNSIIGVLLFSMLDRFRRQA